MKIPQIIIDELISQARQDAPNETCGYLLGISGDEEDEVTENYWMENITIGWRISTTRQSISLSPRRISLLR